MTQPLIVLDLESPFFLRLQTLQDRSQRGEIQRRVLAAGGRTAANVMRRQAPQRTGKLRKSIGYRVVIDFRETYAEVGPNIGTAHRAPHAHLVLYGTKPRRTKSGANRGRVQADNFAAKSMTASRAPAIAEMQRAFNILIDE